MSDFEATATASALDSLSVFFIPEKVSAFRKNVCVVGRTHTVVEFAKSNNFIEKRGTKSSATTSHLMYGGLYGLGRLCVPQAETCGLADAIQRDFSYGVYSALTPGVSLRGTSGT